MSRSIPLFLAIATAAVLSSWQELTAIVTIALICQVFLLDGPRLCECHRKNRLTPPRMSSKTKVFCTFCAQDDVCTASFRTALKQGSKKKRHSRLFSGATRHDVSLQNGIRTTICPTRTVLDDVSKRCPNTRQRYDPGGREQAIVAASSLFAVSTRGVKKIQTRRNLSLSKCRPSLGEHDLCPS